MLSTEKQSQFKKPSFRGLFLFLLVCSLPIVLFRIGYKFNSISKELNLLIILDCIIVCYFMTKKESLVVRLPQILLLLATLPVFIINWPQPHLLAVMGLYLLLFLFVPDVLSTDNIFVFLACSTMVAVIVSFYQYWSMSLGVVPGWLELATVSNRLAGVLGQPNLMACLIVVGLFSWLQVLWQRVAQVDWCWFHQIPVVFFFWALMFTGSKAGLLAFVSSLLFLFWGLLRDDKLKLLKKILLHVGCGVSWGLLLFLVIRPPIIGIINARAIDFSTVDASSGSRLIFGASALHMGIDRPWVGVGLGGYRQELGRYMASTAERMHIPYDSVIATLWAHNDFLHIFAECGFIVSLILLFVFVFILFDLWPAKNSQALFCFCSIWSFFVFMQFGHPFNNHILVFYLVFLFVGALQLRTNSIELKFSKKMIVILLMPCLFFINYFIILNVHDMYYLKKYALDVSKLQPLRVDGLISLREKYGYDDLVSGVLTGWEFRYSHLIDLGNCAVKRRDRQLANYLIPEFEKYHILNNTHAHAYLLSHLYFQLGKYSECKKTADQAFMLKPDMYHYSNFGHICLVFDISRHDKIPVTQLLGEDYFLQLIEKKVFNVDVLDNNLCAL